MLRIFRSWGRWRMRESTSGTTAARTGRVARHEGNLNQGAKAQTKRIPEARGGPLCPLPSEKHRRREPARQRIAAISTSSTSPPVLGATRLALSRQGLPGVKRSRPSRLLSRLAVNLRFRRLTGAFSELAEREGFEPSVRVYPGHLLSRQPCSTTPAPLRRASQEGSF